MPKLKSSCVSGLSRLWGQLLSGGTSYSAGTAGAATGPAGGGWGSPPDGDAGRPRHYHRRLPATPDDIVVVLAVPEGVPAVGVVVAAGVDPELLRRRGIGQRRVAVLANPLRFCKATARWDEEAKLKSSCVSFRFALGDCSCRARRRRAACAADGPSPGRRRTGEGGRELRGDGDLRRNDEERGREGEQGSDGCADEPRDDGYI
ncbi:hypothetical protein ZWY2020_058989 [Hordeum vulgare]|nr:hypothetical protein ZWY2020_058989 [Hordeum vulgare]